MSGHQMLALPCKEAFQIKMLSHKIALFLVQASYLKYFRRLKGEVEAFSSICWVLIAFCSKLTTRQSGTFRAGTSCSPSPCNLQSLMEMTYFCHNLNQPSGIWNIYIVIGKDEIWKGKVVFMTSTNRSSPHGMRTHVLMLCHTCYLFQPTCKYPLLSGKG